MPCHGTQKLTMDEIVHYEKSKLNAIMPIPHKTTMHVCMTSFIKARLLDTLFFLRKEKIHHTPMTNQLQMRISQ